MGLVRTGDFAGPTGPLGSWLGHLYVPWVPGGFLGVPLQA